MKAPVGSSDIALLFFNLGKKGGGGFLNAMPWSLCLGTDPVLIVREAGWDPGPLWTNVENLACTWFRTQNFPAGSRFKTYCKENLKRISQKWLIMRKFASGLNLCFFRHICNKMATVLALRVTKWNFRIRLPNYTVKYTRRPKTWYFPEKLRSHIANFIFVSSLIQGKKFNFDIFVVWDPFIPAKFSSEYDSVDIALYCIVLYCITSEH
jgi:hypothetical protein